MSRQFGRRAAAKPAPVNSRRTTRDASRRTLRLLSNVDARILGVVVTGAAPGEGYYGAYTSPTAGREPLAADRT